mmetsp:Transcript_106916/g.238591  ORF Transcript_106916/g.238591 Transcript_106916/m.238591 type:complete len:200 (-) Transcript_106916:820-1419(-)
MPKPLVGSNIRLAMAVVQPTAASRPRRRRTSLGRIMGGNTAASTMAARTHFGVGAINAETWGKANMSVAKPLTRPMSGDEAPVIPATMERLREPPTGALPAMPEAKHPRPWPASSRAGLQPPGGGRSASTEMMARKSTAAKASAETTAQPQPPKRSTTSAIGISQGQSLTQLVRAAARPLSSPPAFGGAAGGLPTTSPE